MARLRWGYIEGKIVPPIANLFRLGASILWKMDAGKLIEVLRATLDPNQREQAEKQLTEVSYPFSRHVSQDGRHRTHVWNEKILVFKETVIALIQIYIFLKIIWYRPWEINFECCEICLAYCQDCMRIRPCGLSMPCGIWVCIAST